jgi:hypothetical protein
MPKGRGVTAVLIKNGVSTRLNSARNDKSSLLFIFLSLSNQNCYAFNFDFGS